MRELGEPAGCSLTILRIGRLQILLELGNGLVGVAVFLGDLGEVEPGVGEFFDALAEQIDRFGNVLLLGKENSAQHVARGDLRGVKLQGLAGGGFRFRVAAEEVKRGAEIVVGLREFGIEVQGLLKFVQTLVVLTQADVAGTQNIVSLQKGG